MFDLSGNTYIVTDGTTAGATTPAGINPGSMWAADGHSNVETQFGLVYGFAAQPTNVIAVVAPESSSSWSRTPAASARSTTSSTPLGQRQHGQGRRPQRCCPPSRRPRLSPSSPRIR